MAGGSAPTPGGLGYYYSTTQPDPNGAYPSVTGTGFNSYQGAGPGGVGPVPGATPRLPFSDVPDGTPPINDANRQAFMSADYEARANMQPTMGSLAYASQGGGPSVAAAQGAISQQAAQQQALAAVGASRGPMGAVASNQAAMGGVGGMQAANAHFAQARLGEQQQAMQQYQQAVIEQRANDLKAYGLDEQSAYARASMEVQQNEVNTKLAQAQQQHDQKILSGIMSAVGTAGMAAGA